MARPALADFTFEPLAEAEAAAIRTAGAAYFDAAGGDRSPGVPGPRGRGPAAAGLTVTTPARVQPRARLAGRARRDLCLASFCLAWLFVMGWLFVLGWWLLALGWLFVLAWLLVLGWLLALAWLFVLAVLAGCGFGRPTGTRPGRPTAAQYASILPAPPAAFASFWNAAAARALAPPCAAARSYALHSRYAAWRPPGA